MKNLVVKTWGLGALILCMATGCLQQTKTTSSENNPTQEEEEIWTEGLTPGQIVQGMEITVEEVSSEAVELTAEDEVPEEVSEETEGTNAAAEGLNQLMNPAAVDKELGLNLNSPEFPLNNNDRLMQEDDPPTGEEKELVVKWSLPKLYWNMNLSWNIYLKTDDGDWQPIAAEIAVEDLGDEEYKYGFSWLVRFVHEKIVYFKIEMTDHNGDTYDNVVSFFVFPRDRELQITLSDETSASAPSQLSIGFLEAEWFRLFWDIHELDLPQTKQVTETLAPYTPVIFLMETDFDGWGFAEETVIRKSNSSYCKVVNVGPLPDEGIETRFRYSFEDLPIEQLSIEEDGMFDYNDLIFFVDIMAPEVE